MSVRPKVAVAVLIGLLATALASRVEGAIIALSPLGEAASGSTGAGTGSHDPAEDRDGRGTLVAIDSALPADASGMSVPSASLLAGGAHAAALAVSFGIEVAVPVSCVALRTSLFFPHPPPIGLFRPPRS